MRITTVIKKDVEVTADMLCDICGRTCRDSIDMNFECLDLFVHWGYGSNHDGETWSAEVCETCVNKILAPLIKFKKEERTLL